MIKIVASLPWNIYWWIWWRRGGPDLRAVSYLGEQLALLPQLSPRCVPCAFDANLPRDMWNVFLIHSIMQKEIWNVSFHISTFAISWFIPTVQFAVDERQFRRNFQVIETCRSFCHSILFFLSCSHTYLLLDDFIGFIPSSQLGLQTITKPMNWNSNFCCVGNAKMQITLSSW